MRMDKGETSKRQLDKVCSVGASPKTGVLTPAVVPKAIFEK